ncbi:MAG: hypothetical protein U1F43_19875 [Myxococcota bacterium]
MTTADASGTFSVSPQIVEELMPPKPMVSKLVSDRERSANKVLAAYETHGPLAAKALAERLKPLLAAGEALPDFALVTVLHGRALKAALGAMIAADGAHHAELKDDAPVLADRDAKAAEFARWVVKTRTALTEKFGEDFGGKLGVRGETPTDPSELKSFGRNFIDAFEGLELADESDEEATVVVRKDKLLAKLESSHAALEASLGVVDREDREKEQTQTAKTEAIAAYDAAFTVAANFLEAALAAAGFDELAKKVRPSTRRPGMTVEDANTPEEPAGPTT